MDVDLMEDVEVESPARLTSIPSPGLILPQGPAREERLQMEMAAAVMRVVTRAVQKEKEHLRDLVDQGSTAAIGARAAVAALEDLEEEIERMKWPTAPARGRHFSAAPAHAAEGA